MGRFLACLVSLAMVFVVSAIDAPAARKKTQPVPTKPAPAKPIYDAPMTVAIVRGSSPTCEPSCPEWIAAEGEITGATPAAFARVFKAMGKKKLPIVIRSPGGAINAAVDIGHMIRKRGLDVAVGATMFQGCMPTDKTCKLPEDWKGIYRGSAMDYGGFCYSACPLILASGTKRLASHGTDVGVHQPKTIWTQQRYTYRETYRIVNGKKKVLSRTIIKRYNAGTKVTYGYDKRLRAKLTSFYREMGVDVAILEDSNKATFQNMNQLPGSRVNELHLRTGPESVAILTQPAICRRTPTPANCIEASGVAAPQKTANTPSLPIGVVATDPEMVFVVVRNHSSACEPDCPVWIAADGVITKTSPDKFKSLLRDLGKTRLPVVMHSPGGDVDGAIVLGQLFRANHLPTVVGKTLSVACELRSNTCPASLPGHLHDGRLGSGFCKGSCLAAFAGGEERAVAMSSEMAIHAPGQDDIKGQQSTATKLFSHFTAMHVYKGLMDRLNAVADAEEHVISPADQYALRLATLGDFKSIVPTPGRCAQHHGQAFCLPASAITP